MNVFGRTENEKIVFLALESELEENEIKNGWHALGEVQEMDYASVVNGTWLGKPLFDENGVANYKFSDGSAVERTEAEKQSELAARPAPLPSDKERLAALEHAMLSVVMGGVPNV